jgi:hypothetical protein
MDKILIEISPGELIDRYTILEIKKERIKDPEKLKHIQYEIDILNLDEVHIYSTIVAENWTGLKEVNSLLWEVEDKLRELERLKKFDIDFIELARLVYYYNDLRSQYKKNINLYFKSSIVEEKSYTEYK